MSDDDIPQLSAAALAALQSFLVEKKEQEERFEQIKADAERRFDDVEGHTGAVDMSLFQEDWQLSQFWHDDNTCSVLSTEAHEQAIDDDGNQLLAVFVSSPSAFVRFRSVFPDHPCALLEYDKRFEAAFPAHFHLYDYREPAVISPELLGKAAVVVVDPPFLSLECLERMSETVRKLLLPASSPGGPGKVMLCTGVVMRRAAMKLLGAHQTAFRPGHRNGLSNEFRCFVSGFESERMVPEQGLEDLGDE